MEQENILEIKDLNFGRQVKNTDINLTPILIFLNGFSIKNPPSLFLFLIYIVLSLFQGYFIILIIFE